MTTNITIVDGIPIKSYGQKKYQIPNKLTCISYLLYYEWQYISSMFRRENIGLLTYAGNVARPHISFSLFRTTWRTIDISYPMHLLSANVQFGIKEKRSTFIGVMYFFFNYRFIVIIESPLIRHLRSHKLTNILRPSIYLPPKL